MPQNNTICVLKNLPCPGEVAENDSINTDKIVEEEKYDGFYGVCINLEDKISTIVAVSKSLWKLEECLRNFLRNLILHFLLPI